MKWTFVAFALAAWEVSALHLVDRRASGEKPKVVGHKIRRYEVSDPFERDRSRYSRRQDDTVELSLSNNVSLYYLDITIGTPPQNFRVAVDTGSSDLWVNSVDSDECSTYGYYDECKSGTYSPGDSSTYEFLNQDFAIRYADNTEAQGNWVTDVVGFGDISITGQQFGNVLTSESPNGIMGIGYQDGEAVTHISEVYDNVPLSLLNQGHISSLAYSIWLNDLDSSEGELLFGGINRAKFEGSLTSVPIIQYSGLYQRLAVTLDDVAVSGTSVSGSISAPVILDSGTTYTYLPSSIVNNIYQTVNATANSYSETAVVDCDLAKYSDTLDFTFQGATIRVPMNELVIPARTGHISAYRLCSFGILPASYAGGTYLLGDTFLRSAYVVYDLHNNEISLAQTVFNSTQDDIVEIANEQPVGSLNAQGDATTTAAPIATGGPSLTVSTEAIPPTATPQREAESSNAGAMATAGAVVPVLGAVAAAMLW